MKCPECDHDPRVPGFRGLCPGCAIAAEKEAEKEKARADQAEKERDEARTQLGHTQSILNLNVVRRGEFFDLDSSQNEEVWILWHDKTWQHVAGQTAFIGYVPFVGKPSAIAEEIQKLRDDMQCGNHVVVRHAKVGLRGRGEIAVYVQLYLTSLPGMSNPLLRIDRLILRVIGDGLLQMATETETVLHGLVAEHMTGKPIEELDLMFLRRVRATIEAVEASHGNPGKGQK